MLISRITSLSITLLVINFGLFFGQSYSMGLHDQLRVAVDSSDHEIIDDLLKRGAHADGCVKWCMQDQPSCLHRALTLRDGASLTRLLNYIEDEKELKTEIGNSPWHEAARSNDVYFMRCLYEALCRIRAKNLFPSFSCPINRGLSNIGIRPIHYAAATGNEEMVAFLIDQKADICGPYSGYDDASTNKFFHCTPLHVACLFGHSGCVEHLLHAGATLGNSVEYKEFANLPGTSQLTPNCLYKGYLTELHWTVLYEHIDCMMILLRHMLENGKDSNFFSSSVDQDCLIDKRNYPDGWTAIHLAALAGNKLFLQILAQAKARLDMPDIMGYTPLHCAAMMGHWPCVEYLIQQNCSADFQAKQGETPLFLAFSSGRLECFRTMLRILGASIDQKDRWRYIHCAAEKGSIELLDVCHEYKISPNEPSQYGSLPLHCAKSTIVKRLHKMGANHDACNGGGHTPLFEVLSRCPTSDSTAKIKELLDIGASVQGVNNVGLSSIDLVLGIHSLIGRRMARNGKKDYAYINLNLANDLLKHGAVDLFDYPLHRFLLTSLIQEMKKGNYTTYFPFILKCLLIGIAHKRLIDRCTSESTSLLLTAIAGLRLNQFPTAVISSNILLGSYEMQLESLRFFYSVYKAIPYKKNLLTIFQDILLKIISKNSSLKAEELARENKLLCYLLKNEWRTGLFGSETQIFQRLILNEIPHILCTIPPQTTSGGSEDISIELAINKMRNDPQIPVELRQVLDPTLIEENFQNCVSQTSQRWNVMLSRLDSLISSLPNVISEKNERYYPSSSTSTSSDSRNARLRGQGFGMFI